MHPQYILRAFSDNSGPIFETNNLEDAVKELRKCGLSYSTAKKIAENYLKQGRTWENFKNITTTVKSKLPDVIFDVCIHSQYVPKLTLDPETKECINTSSWALNFGKWNLINPETGKPFTLEETQEFMNKFTKGSPSESKTM